MGGITTVTVGDLVGSVAPGPVVTGVTVAAQIFGALAFAYALLRLTTLADSRAQRAALGLDIATLTVGCMILMGHTVLDDLDGGKPLPTATRAVLVTSALGVFLVARLAVGGSRMLPPRALAATAISAAVGGMVTPGTMLLLGWTPGAPGSEPLMLVPVIADLALAYSARFWLTDDVVPALRTWRRFLPYAAVVAVDALLIVHVDEGDSGLLLITGGAVLLTGLVVARQIVAAQENAGLLRRLAEEEERFRLLVQRSSDVVAISEADGRMRYCSPAVGRVLGLDPALVPGTAIYDWAHPDDVAAMRECWEQTLAGPGASAICRTRVRDSAGEWRWLEIITSNLLHEPSVRGVLTNSRDITETWQANERLSYEAAHDALTGLANRVLFTDRVAAALDRAGPYSVVLVDLDGFKAINDTLGHAAGDALLIAVAERMQASVRPADTVARLGGDEFAILLDGLAADAVDRVLTRIAEALLVPVPLRDQLISVRASFGVAEPGGDPVGGVDELLHRADVAMYAAKSRGQGGHVRFREGMQIQKHPGRTVTS